MHQPSDAGNVATKRGQVEFLATQFFLSARTQQSVRCLGDTGGMIHLTIALAALAAIGIGLW